MSMRAGKYLLWTFFTECNCEEEYGGTEDDTLPFSRIAEIITNQHEIDELEKELSGEV